MGRKLEPKTILKYLQLLRLGNPKNRLGNPTLLFSLSLYVAEFSNSTNLYIATSKMVIVALPTNSPPLISQRRWV